MIGISRPRVCWRFHVGDQAHAKPRSSTTMSTTLHFGGHPSPFGRKVLTLSSLRCSEATAPFSRTRSNTSTISTGGRAICVNVVPPAGAANTHESTVQTSIVWPARRPRESTRNESVHPTSLQLLHPVPPPRTNAIRNAAPAARTRTGQACQGESLTARHRVGCRVATALATSEGTLSAQPSQYPPSWLLVLGACPCPHGQQRHLSVGCPPRCARGIPCPPGRPLGVMRLGGAFPPSSTQALQVQRPNNGDGEQASANDQVQAGTKHGRSRICPAPSGKHARRHTEPSHR